LFSQAAQAFKQSRVFQQALSLALYSILMFGRRTVTGMLAAGGKQFKDWSSAYRIFQHNRFDRGMLFEPIIRTVHDCLGDGEPFYAVLDDTLIRKRGRKISGTAWKRDPLGPAFHTNFIWGQRYLQMSALLPDKKVQGRARAIPIDFIHAPSAKKPRKNAQQKERDEYKVAVKPDKVTVLGSKRIHELRGQVAERKLICAVDGAFTNQEVFRNIPANTAIIGRVRKDARLFNAPECEGGIKRGRKKFYGTPLPTPEQMRQDNNIPWQRVRAYAAGKEHDFDVKVVSPVRWKGSGERDVLILIVRPLSYRPRKGAKLLYRNPAYLICTDVSLTLDYLLQGYIWRWEIEVNFRDEKTIMGVGQSGVRTEDAVKNLPAFQVATYAYMLLAAELSEVSPASLPTPKWQRETTATRCSTQKIQSVFRSEFWFPGSLENKNGFMHNPPHAQTRFFSITCTPLGYMLVFLSFWYALSLKGFRNKLLKIVTKSTEHHNFGCFRLL
jgi:hypothetical protein